MSKKWFEYRRLHPMQSTYYFMHCYLEAYKEFHRVVIDHEAANYVRPTKSVDFIHTREKLSFWRLRQTIDELGIRYDFFLGRAMKWYAEQCFHVGEIFAPRPQHIGCNEDLVAYVIECWEDQLAIELQIPKSDFFKVSNFFGHPDQLAFEDFLVNQIASRHIPRHSLKAALYNHKSLRIEEAIRSFGEGVVLNALNEFCEEQQDKSEVKYNQRVV